MKRLLVMSFLLLQSHCFLSGAGQRYQIRKHNVVFVTMHLEGVGGRSLFIPGGLSIRSIGFADCEEDKSVMCVVNEDDSTEKIVLDKNVVPFLERSSGSEGLVSIGARSILLRAPAGRMAIKIPEEEGGVGRVDIESPE